MRSDDIFLDAGDVALEGTMTLPREPSGIVLFAHGSGSSRRSPRNRLVAGVLNDAGIGTLLFDLLTPEESALDEQTGELRFDIGMNQRAAARLGAEHRLEIVPGATHLFEEPGKLEQVARLARDWFHRHLGAAARRRRDAAGSSAPVPSGTSQ